MEHLGSLLDTLPLPDEADLSVAVRSDPLGAPEPGLDADERLRDADLRLRKLGADLPAGHLHVWGGPSGAGKTSFLLSLLHCAARRRRPVVYATYDLPPSGLALRMLAMLADVELRALPDPGGTPDTGSLTREELARVVHARSALRELPFWLLPARGFTSVSLADRLARAPVRPEVCVVDYVQAVVREPGTELGLTLRELSELSVRQHVAMVGVFRADGSTHDALETAEDVLGVGGTETDAPVGEVAARVGWIAPADESGSRRAEVISNRYGSRPSVALNIDPETGRVDTRATDAPAVSDAAGTDESLSDRPLSGSAPA